MPALPEDSPGPRGFTAPEPLFVTAFEPAGRVVAPVDRARVEPVVAGCCFTKFFFVELFVAAELDDALPPTPDVLGFSPDPIVPTAPEP
jgi:hypothetical protein